MKVRLLLSGALACLAAGALSQAYTIQSVGVLPGHDSSLAYGLNAIGQVTGYSYATGSSDFRAFRWISGVRTNLGTLGGNQSIGNDINGAGIVVGGSNLVNNGFNHAFSYSGGGPMQDLGTLGGAFSKANGINGVCNIVGEAMTGGGQIHAFRKIGGGALNDLGSLGGSLSVAEDINAANQVAGDSDLVSGDRHAYRYTDGPGMVDIGVLPGGTYARGLAINEAGQVVGFSGVNPINSVYHAYRWTEGVGMVDLGTFGGVDTRAQDINTAGKVVGSSWETNNGATSRAFLWVEGVGMQKLNDLIDPALGWNLKVAYGINDSDQIAGWGILGGQTLGFLMTPIPEPATLAGLGGLLALLAARRRR